LPLTRPEQLPPLLAVKNETIRMVARVYKKF
jgi:hypothetical protein